MTKDPAQSGGEPPSIERFIGAEPTRDLADWAWLWTGDQPFPVRSGGGLRGRLVSFLKRLLRPFAKAPVADLWERQKVFNLILLETLAKQQAENRSRLDSHGEHLLTLDDRTIQAMQAVMRHNDALFARVDQKLDRYRREAKDLWHRLGALIAADQGSAATAEGSRGEVLQEQGYLALEQRYRGSEEEIASRVAAYLKYVQGRGELLDLGCGRGEALEVFAAEGLEVRGVDFSSEMVALCREKGLRADQGDLFEYLSQLDEGQLGAIVSFHVIEHLPADSLPRLVRLAWRALAPGGVLIFETPSPLSIGMSARNFWIDPTHLRPVHPAWLEVTFREAGFEPVHRVDLHPFPDDERLPEIDLDQLDPAQRHLADQVNRMRDLLDDLLFGHRDFGMVGIKP